ncbi:Sushi, von Willebrand factor type A, EGF and pentraxin domain-containing protein 1 [Chelonia mydas]|uniref:Sushi, von Willebrand factor type A, EGF and pentraxin domain-containing protein 1 n=1 Tax=Chelonia mydas TaxID=8469 RepID=M7APD9_CHEMY|nr:Sushi, von Willebrand factor type A, EGF and pentraxin domain-containing protein 1 [Chelonia mydas]
MFLTELMDRGGGPGSQYWMGLARLRGEAEFTWVDGIPISKSWYRNWLWSYPKDKHCVQLVGFYLNQWRDWDCNSTSSFICEMPATDAFPSSVRAVRFRSHCYTFHFPALWEMRTWPQALAFCKQFGGSLASVQGEDENAFLSGSCGLPAPVEFPLPGGMGPYATADVVFSLPRYSVCTVMLMKAHTRTALFQLRLESNATQVYGSVAAEFTGALVQKELVPVPFSAGLNTWGFITFPAGMIGFFNHQEHFRVFSDRAISFANLGSLLISGVTVANASLEYRVSSAMRFPSGNPALRSAMRLENAAARYLSSFTLGLWIRSTFASANKMGLLSYVVRSRPAELALFLLAPAGLEFWLKGAVILSGTTGLLLDGSWHHLAISISSDLSASPYMVFIDGEPWEPDFADSAWFLWKGLAVGGEWNVGQPEIVDKGGLTLGSPYVGELSEVNLWDRALPRLSVKQLAASRDKWKFPGNVMSWSQLADARSGAMEITTASHSAERALVYVEPAAERCPRNSLWGLQLDARLRSLTVPSSCLLVGLDGVSLGCSSDCSSDGRSSFRLLPDQRLQNLHSGFCVFQKPRSPRLFLQKCSSHALRFALDEDVHCPRAQSWRSRKDKCLHIVAGAPLEWNQALKYCQRFQNGSLLTLSSPEDQLCGTPYEGRGPEKRCPSGSFWSCQRAEEVELPALREKLLISFQDFVWQRHASLGAAKDSCFLQRENCTGVMQLHGTHYTMNGTVLVDSPGSGATLYIKSGLVSGRCPRGAGWWYWDGHCYYVEESDAKTWQQAEAACSASGEGMGLLALNSLEEKAWVTAMVQKDSWTGLNDLDGDGSWTWAVAQYTDGAAPCHRSTQSVLAGNWMCGGAVVADSQHAVGAKLTDQQGEWPAPHAVSSPHNQSCTPTPIVSTSTEWFVKQPGRGVVGDPAFLHPSAESLEKAKQECLRERSVCPAVLQAGTGFYLIGSMAGIISRPNSTLYVWTICAEGFSGLRCHRYTVPQQRPACDCSGRVRVSATQVCGVPVQSCIDYCRHTTAQSNCSLCLPVCSDSSLGILDPEELAVVSMVQYKVSQSLNLTSENEHDQMNASKIIYHSALP